MNLTEDHGVGEGIYLNDIDGDKYVAIVLDGGEDVNQPSKEEAKKIARLLKAAPELLEACKAICQACGDKYGWPDNFLGKSELSDSLENAIAKAEGRQYGCQNKT